MKEGILCLVCMAFSFLGLAQNQVYKGLVNRTAPNIYKDQYYREILDYPPLQKGDSVVLIALKFTPFDEIAWRISLGKLTGYVADDMITVNQSTKEKFLNWGERAPAMFLTPEQVLHEKREEARKDSISASYLYLYNLTKEQVLAKLGEPREIRMADVIEEYANNPWAAEIWFYEKIELMFSKGKVESVIIL